MRDISDELVERMVALVRHMAAHTHREGPFAEARGIAALLPDPDIEEARAIAKPWLIYDDVQRLEPQEPALQAILKAIKRGRELANEERR